MNQLFFTNFNASLQLAKHIQKHIAHIAEATGVSCEEAQTECEKELLAAVESALPQVPQGWKWDKTNSLLRSVFSAVRRELFIGACFRFVSDSATVGGAIAMRELMKWMISSSYSHDGPPSERVLRRDDACRVDAQDGAAALL